MPASCFLVLGTPRSGTSCVAGILSKLGVFMGERHLPANPMNEAGFFQDVEFEELFDGIPEWMPLPGSRLEFDRAKFRALIVRRCALRQDWGVKFRLAAFVLDEFLAASRMPVKLLITSRDRAASIASLTRWSEQSDPDPATVIGRSRQAVDGSARNSGLPFLDVDYESLLADPAGQVARIAAFVGCTVTLDAVSLVNPALRRY